VHFLKSEGENVFYVILIVVVLSLTVWLWLAGQPQRTENAESPQIIQYVVKGTETDASVQRSEKQKETKQNAPKKQTARD
jgi:cytoskeletal protein RodZ